MTPDSGKSGTRPETKPRVVSGVQPTGHLTIGNYIGALKNWVLLQASHEAYFMLADLHAITARQDPHVLRHRSLEFGALLLASGVDPQESAIFLQSQVPAHAQLFWILNCFAPVGELQRMTQFKDKGRQQPQRANAGLFGYPVLMAADILLYDADLVPVGEDQKQHLEFTRSLARRFNGICGEVFRIPEIRMPKRGARIKGLQNPLAKMSKSDENPDNYIALLDPPDTISRKIKIAVTDSGREVACGPSKEGVCGLITLRACISGESPEEIQARYAGKGYAEFKKDLAEMVIDFLEPIRSRYRSIAADPGSLTEVLKQGAETARVRSQAALKRVCDAVGFAAFEPETERHSKGRYVMKNMQLSEAGIFAQMDTSADEECIPDCCDCCCCGDEEECTMEE